MTALYADTSALLAVALREPGYAAARRHLQAADLVLVSHLVEAEYLARLARERRVADLPGADRLSWVVPDRRLTEEMRRVLAVGGLRGADLWHGACALFVDPTAADLGFLTLDERQATVARSIGFRVCP